MAALTSSCEAAQAAHASVGLVAAEVAGGCRRAVVRAVDDDRAAVGIEDAAAGAAAAGAGPAAVAAKPKPA
jgi:hypothetical protein